MFVGSKTQEELADIFNRSTAVVVPSYYESFGMVAAEAQACGTPVIASGVGGLQNVVSDGFTGITCKTEKSRPLIKSYEYIIKGHLFGKRVRETSS